MSAEEKLAWLIAIIACPFAVLLMPSEEEGMSELEPTRTNSNPTATEELRRMLDERGVEWETDRSGFRVMWGKPVDEFHDTMQFKAVDNALPNGGLNVHICGFTPEQAIAATLGAQRPTLPHFWTADGTLHVEPRRMPERVQAHLGGEDVTFERGLGTCHVKSRIIDTYEYNRWEYELSCGHTIIWESSDPPNFCPNCGKRVEVDDG